MKITALMTYLKNKCYCRGYKAILQRGCSLQVAEVWEETLAPHFQFSILSPMLFPRQKISWLFQSAHEQKFYEISPGNLHSFHLSFLTPPHFHGMNNIWTSEYFRPIPQFFFFYLTFHYALWLLNSFSPQPFSHWDVLPVWFSTYIFLFFFFPCSNFEQYLTAFDACILIPCGSRLYGFNNWKLYSRDQDCIRTQKGRWFGGSLLPRKKHPATQ